jgi:3-hydroxybutyryl-CoA dehydrogenase
MHLQRVGVLGCGLMGHGIAQVAAQAGCDVVVREIDPDVLERGLRRIEKQRNLRRRALSAALQVSARSGG